MTLPTYNHNFVAELINYSEGLPKEKIDEGLALPRESFIEDLEKLLSDIQSRKEYYYNEVKDKSIGDEHLLVRQIFNFLSILQAKQSLPKLIEVINEEEEFIDFWFGNFIEESYIAFIFYPLFKDNFDFLLEAILNKKSQLAVQGGLLNIAAQVAIKEPNRREDAIDFYINLIDFMLKQEVEDCILDDFEIDTLIHSILLMKGKELREKVLELYNKGLVSEMIAEKEELLRELEKPIISIKSTNKLDLELTSYEIFERIVGYNYNCELTREEREMAEKRLEESLKNNNINIGRLLKKARSHKWIDEIDWLEDDDDIEDDVFVKHYDPKTDKPQYARNDKVTVKYQDGKIIENTKYKKVEKDIKAGKCFIV